MDGVKYGFQEKTVGKRNTGFDFPLSDGTRLVYILNGLTVDCGHAAYNYRAVWSRASVSLGRLTTCKKAKMETQLIIQSAGVHVLEPI